LTGHFCYLAKNLLTSNNVVFGYRKVVYCIDQAYFVFSFLVVTVSLQASQIDVTEASTNAIVLVTVNGAREREISVK
jgi:hypothetical protein